MGGYSIYIALYCNNVVIIGISVNLRLQIENYTVMLTLVMNLLSTLSVRLPVSES